MHEKVKNYALTDYMTINLENKKYLRRYLFDIIKILNIFKISDFVNSILVFFVFIAFLKATNFKKEYFRFYITKNARYYIHIEYTYQVEFIIREISK